MNSRVFSCIQGIFRKTELEWESYFNLLRGCGVYSNRENIYARVEKIFGTRRIDP
jgi:hypothetical protein